MAHKIYNSQGQGFTLPEVPPYSEYERYPRPPEPEHMPFRPDCGNRLIHMLMWRPASKPKSRYWTTGEIIMIVVLIILIAPVGLVLLFSTIHSKKKARESVITHCDGCNQVLDDKFTRIKKGYYVLDFHLDSHKDCREKYHRREVDLLWEGPTQLVAAPYDRQVYCDGCNVQITNTYYKVIQANIQIDYCCKKCKDVHHNAIVEKILQGDTSRPPAPK